MTARVLLNKHAAHRDFIAQIAPFIVLKLDIDGTVVDSEAVAAQVTVDILNGYLQPYGKGIDLTYVCGQLSGKKFETQLTLIQRDCDVVLPPGDLQQIKEQKKARNLEALARETQAIAGVAAFLRFVVDHEVHAIGVTQSDEARIQKTFEAPGCQSIAPYITTSLEKGMGSSRLIPILSARSSVTWMGETYQILDKPDPSGYQAAYSIVSQHISRQQGREIKPVRVICEDSATGFQAAAHAEADLVIGVALGGHIHDRETFEGTMHRIVPRDKAHILLPDENTNPWTAALLRMLELGLQCARTHGVENLPETLPAAIVSYVSHQVNCPGALGFSSAACDVCRDVVQFPLEALEPSEADHPVPVGLRWPIFGPVPAC